MSWNNLTLPDFLVDTPEGTSGIEFTQFTLTPRRLAHAQFRSIRDILLEQGPLEWLHLRGYQIYVWVVQSSERLGLPLRGDARILLLQALRNYNPPSTPVIGNELPKVMPNIGVGNAGGWAFHGVRFDQGVPNSDFFDMMGFELGLVFQTEVTWKHLNTELCRIVEKHDQVGVDDLVITVGAPDQLGLTYPSDEAAIRFWIKSQQQFEPHLMYINRILLHLWRDRKVIVLAQK